jgi:hypothetical protein
MKHLLVIIFLLMSFGAFAQTDTTVTNTVILDGTGSNDSFNQNGGIVKYQWSQTAGPTVSIPTPTAVTNTIILSQPGIYDFQLTVTNKAGLTDSQVMEFPVISGDMKPVAKIKVIGVIKLPPQK